MAGSGAKRRIRSHRLRVRVSATAQQAFDRLYVSTDADGKRRRMVPVEELAADWVERRCRNPDPLDAPADPDEDAAAFDIDLSPRAYEWLLDRARSTGASAEQVASAAVNERGHELIEVIRQGRRIMGLPPLADL